MDWWTELGNYAAFTPDAPALAVDMGLSGPSHHAFGMGLAYSMQNTADPLEVYPDTSSPLGQ